MQLMTSSLADQAFEIVREKILTSEFPPLTSIRQDALAGELGISKIPLREALTRLEQNGLLRSSPNKGFVVPALNADEAEDIFALRLKLEPEAAARACLIADDQQRQAAILAHARLMAASGETKAGYTQLHRDFHAALTSSNQHLVSMRMLDRLHTLADRYVYFHLQPQGRGKRASNEHKRLLNAWLKRNADDVQKQLEQHISSTLVDLRVQLANAAKAAVV